jgi:hypothetical protein
MNTLPPSIRAAASRYKTRSSLLHSHENHDLHSLSRRLLLSPSEVLGIVSDGKLLALGDRINFKYAFSAAALDSLRNNTVSFIANTVSRALSGRVDEEHMAMAFQRAMGRQHELARGQGEDVIEFDQSAPGSFVNGVAGGAGLVAGAGLAGYGAYRYLKGRKRNPDGTLQLPNGPGPDGIDDAIDITPRPRNPSGSSGANEPRHPDPVGPPRLTNASPLPNAADDALSKAVRAGRQSIARRGSSVLAALRGLKA